MLVQLAPRADVSRDVYAEAKARGADCERCPLYGQHAPVLGQIKSSCLTVVGEAPGPREVKQGVPFVGPSGTILNRSLADGGLNRDDVAVTNTILCRPPEEQEGSFTAYVNKLRSDYAKRRRGWLRQYTRPEDADEPNWEKIAEKRYERMRAQGIAVDEPPALILPQDACRPRLMRDLNEANSKVLLAVGAQALEGLRVVLGLPHAKDKAATDVDPDLPRVAGLRKQAGAPIFLRDGRVLMSSYHPAFAMRDKREFAPVIEWHLARAARIAVNDGRIEWTEPDFILQPSADEAIAWLQDAQRTRVEITLDVEGTDKDPHVTQLRCIGFGRITPEESVMVMPIRHMDGSLWYDQETTERLRLLVQNVLDHNPLVFHNGNYDVTCLLNGGYMTDRARHYSDTMILHHNTTACDRPHGLGDVMRELFDAPQHKSDVDHKSIDVRYDATLFLYNARDVLGTMRARLKLKQQVYACSTVDQTKTDLALLPIIREMSSRGLWLNEWKRGQFSEYLNTKVHALTRQFQAVSGTKINPRSNTQLMELFFDKWGYDPVVDGLEEGEEPDEDDLEEARGVGSPQLTKLMKQYRLQKTAPDHYKAIDTLLQLRAHDKLRGTYVDNAKTTPLDEGDRYGYAPEVVGTRYDPETDEDVSTLILPRRPGFSRARTTYKAHVTPTGRLASGDPWNFQNVPALGRGGLNMRSMFVAPWGHCFVGEDYEQIEARIYAIVAGDLLLLEAIEKKLDLHSLNCASLLANPGEDLMKVYQRIVNMPKELKKYWRTVAKVFCFLKIYGGSKEKLYDVMIANRNKATGELAFPNLSKDDTLRWSDNWDRLHPWTMAWHERCHATFKEYGHIRSPMLDRRARFFPGGLSQINAVPNMTIQASAAAIANRSLQLINDAIPFGSWSPWTGLCLQVHDYIAAIVPIERRAEAKRIIQECMEYVFRGMTFTGTAEWSYTWGAQ